MAKRRKKTKARKTKRKTKAKKKTKRKTKAKKRGKKKAKRRKTGAKKRRTTGRKKSRAKKKTKKKSKRKPNAAFMAPMQPSPALAAVVGSKAIPRTQVVKKIWKYIKKKNLQDPKNRRNIRADENLLKVFKGKKVVTMFQMTKLLNKQLKKAA